MAGFGSSAFLNVFAAFHVILCRAKSGLPHPTGQVNPDLVQEYGEKYEANFVVTLVRPRATVSRATQPKHRLLRLPAAGLTFDFRNQLERIHRLLVTPTAKVIPESAAERHGSADFEPRRDSCPARGVPRVRNTLEPIVRLLTYPYESAPIRCESKGVICRKCCLVPTSVSGTEPVAIDGTSVSWVNAVLNVPYRPVHAVSLTNRRIH